MNNKIVLSIAFSILCIRVINAGEIEDENLILKQPVPTIGGPWRIFEKVRKNSKTGMWVNKDKLEFFITTVIYKNRNKNINLNEWKKTKEEIASNSCLDFISSPSEETLENGYKVLNWKSICKTKNNFTRTVLYKVISGNDAYYLVKKIWKNKVTKKSLDTWSRYINKAYVCDSRHEQHTCTTGFRTKN